MLPAVTVDTVTVQKLKNGSPSAFTHPDGRVRVYGQDGVFWGVAIVQDNVLRVEKLFITR